MSEANIRHGLVLRENDERTSRVCAAQQCNIFLGWK